MVRFDCDGDAPTSCGGCEDKRGEKLARSENGSENEEGCKKDSKFLVILLSSLAESEPLCEMAAETVIRRTWFPNHKTVESEGSKRGVVNGRRQHRGKRRRENADHVNSRWNTIEGYFPSDKR